MHSTSKAKQMAIIALMTAVICVLSPFSLSIPISPVPISLCSMGIYFVVTVLGMKKGTLSVLLYLLIGFAGVPVFAGFTAGAVKLFGPTGGYIIGYLFLALIFGFFSDRFDKNLFLKILGAVLGTLVLYLFGTIWLAFQLHLGFIAALWAGVIPYIPGDIVKLAIALLLGQTLRRRLVKAGLIA